MGRVWTTVVCVCLLAMTSQAQSSEQSGATASQQTAVGAQQSGGQAQSSTSVSASQQAQTTSPLPAGSLVYAELSKTVDAKKAKPGDEISAKTTQGVLAHGKVLIPKGSKLLGHVTQAQARTKEQEHSELGIVFDHAVLKDGTQIPVSLTIQALGSLRASPAFENPTDNQPMGAGSGMPSSAAGRTPGQPGGALGGAGSTVGGVANTTGGTVGTIAGDTAGVDTGGHLGASSHGVVGLSNLNLSTSANSSTKASVITSDSRNVKLEGGTEFVLRAN
jgi:hypothetical protein